MKKLISYFLQGMVFIAPFGITIYIVYWIFTTVDGLLETYLEKYMGFSIPGMGLIIIILLLTFVGFIGQTIIARPFKSLFSRLMKRAPLLKVIYSSLNDLFSAFVGKEKKFNQPVLVKVNNSTNLEKMGFITQRDLSDFKIKDKVAVYFPHSYNFSGELFIVPMENVVLLDVPSAEAMKFIVSGGVSKN